MTEAFAKEQHNCSRCQHNCTDSIKNRSIVQCLRFNPVMPVYFDSPNWIRFLDHHPVIRRCRDQLSFCACPARPASSCSENGVLGRTQCPNPNLSSALLRKAPFNYKFTVSFYLQCTLPWSGLNREFKQSLKNPCITGNLRLFLISWKMRFQYLLCISSSPISIAKPFPGIPTHPCFP